MDIVYSGFPKRGCELTLGKTWPARGGDRPCIDQQLNLCALELVEDRGGLCLLVSNCEQRTSFCFSRFCCHFDFHFNHPITSAVSVRPRGSGERDQSPWIPACAGMNGGPSFV